MIDTLSHIAQGFGVALQPANLGYTFLGVLLGTVIGVLPGIGPAATMALLIPLCFGMEPTTALIMMAGVYYGAMYGGSTTSILINTPGEASSVMTALDGHQMAKQGRAGAALAVSAWASFLAGTAGIVALTLLSAPMKAIALMFGPAEYFALMVFSLSAVSLLSGTSPAKALLSTMCGLALATVGVDLQTGLPRYTMGIAPLQEGINFVIVVVGLFAIAEVLTNIEDLLGGRVEIIRLRGKLMLTREEWRRSMLPIIRGSGIGFFVGVLPGAGATIATILSYTTEKRLSRNPETFGRGAIEGVAGPEAANNASTTGALVPLLTLGVPGSGSAAVLMGAFIMFGIQPGPLLFEKNPQLVWGLIDSMYVGNVMLLVLNLPLVGLFVRLLYIPTGVLVSLVLAVSAIGVYALNGSVFDLYLALFFGVVGYAFRKLDVPVAPLVLALVLGGLMEQSFRQATALSGGNPVVFLQSGISLTLLGLAGAAIVVPILAPRFVSRLP